MKCDKNNIDYNIAQYKYKFSKTAIKEKRGVSEKSIHVPCLLHCMTLLQKLILFTRFEVIYRTIIFECFPYEYSLRFNK